MAQEDIFVGSEQPETQENQSPLNQDALDILNDLKTLNDLDSEFDKLFKTVVTSKSEDQILSSNIQRVELNGLNFLMDQKKALSGNVSNEDKLEAEDDINALLNTNSGDVLKLFNDSNIQNNRKKLYDLYNEISEINPIAYRMLKVYVDNILVKNMQNKQFINFIENDNNTKMMQMEDGPKKVVLNLMKTISIYFDIQNKLKNNILPNMLKHGDYYIEVVNLTPIDNIISKRKELITESFAADIFNPTISTKQKVTLTMGAIEFPGTEIQETHFSSAEEDPNIRMIELLNSKSNSKLMEEVDINMLNDILGITDNTNNEKLKNLGFSIEDTSSLDFTCLKDIFLKFVNPSNVIKIEQDGINFGYLIIEDLADGDSDAEEINLYQRFTSNDPSNKRDKNKNKDVTKIISEKYSKEIISKLNDYLLNSGASIGDLGELNDELSLSLKIILYQKIKEKSKLKFRFLEPKNLINFHTNIDKFAPYGTSVFDPIVLYVKLYTVALMSSVISRLSRASVLRKWNVEVGNRRNNSQIIQNVQKELKTKNITFDSLSNFKNISQVLTDFRDIATVSKNGQKFIDLELLPMQDRALPMNDLQDLRNELIASTGIPSVYLNVGDQADLRETLVNLNIGFANTIAGYQGYTEDGLNQLYNTIFQIILKHNGIDDPKFNLTQYFQAQLNPPLVLQLQNNEAVISSISGIIGALQQAQVNVDAIELFKLYAPQINWDKIEKSGEKHIKEAMKDQAMQQPPQGEENQGF